MHMYAECLGGAIAVVAVTALFAWLLWKRRSRSGKDNQLLQQRLMQSEMRALRSQMNPHFIFNAINSIQHYVLTNERELANKYLVKFSRLMRNILDLSKEELICLGDELETVNLYLEIESLRFNDAFSFSIRCDSSVDPSKVKIPPMLIQPFAENAIWHGLLLKDGPKELVITINRDNGKLRIAVDDNGIGRESAGRFRNQELRRRSHGMEITRSRLDVLKAVHGIDITMHVIDKTDEASRSAGTRVVLELAEH